MQVMRTSQIDGIDMQLRICDYFCSTEIFTINGVDATASDFGISEDLAPWDAGACSCGNHTFRPYEHPTDEVLKKYNINKKQFTDIAYELADGLSFGKCSLCE